MDVAASAFAVVSLAIQLVDTIRETRRFVRNVRDAAKEWKRLIDLLEHLELIIEGIGIVFKEKEANRVTIFSKSVFKALGTCETKFATLEGLVKKFQSVNQGKTKTVRAWSALKLASKEEVIREFECQLRDALMILSITMSTYSTYGAGKTAKTLLIINSNLQYQNTDAIIKKIETLESQWNDQTTLLRSNTIPSDKATTPEGSSRDLITENQSTHSVQVSRLRKTATRTYDTLLGRLVVREKKSTMAFKQNHQTPKTNVLTLFESTWTFSPAFLSSRIELQYRNTGPWIWPNIKHYNVLDDDDFRSLHEACYNGDLTALQACFKNRKGITPFVTNSSGQSLLHIATWNYQYDMCKYLFHLGLRPSDVVDKDGREALWYLGDLHRADWENLEIVRLYTTFSPEALADSRLMFWKEYSVWEFEWMVNEFVTRDNVNLFDDSPLLCAFRSMQRYDCRYFRGRVLWYRDQGIDVDDFNDCEMEPLLDIWKGAIRNVIQKDADIHRFSEDGHLSLLQELMIIENCPFQAQAMIDLWLDLLSSSGVDVASYLKMEMDHHRKNKIFLKDLEGRQRCIVFQLGYLPPVSWDWWVNPQGPVHEVLQEFKHIGPPVDCTYETGWSPIYGAMGDNWPFVHPKSWYPLFFEPSPALAESERRFERRQRKKAMKYAKAHGLFWKGPRLPGSWVD